MLKPVVTASILGQKRGGVRKQATLNTLAFTNAVLAKHKDLFESHHEVVRLQAETGALKGRVLAVVWTDDALRNTPFIADCKVSSALCVAELKSPPHTLHLFDTDQHLPKIHKNCRR